MNPEDQEQLEAFRAWWKENGTSAVLGIAIGLGGVGSWQGYEAYQSAQVEAAGEIYYHYRNHLRGNRRIEALARAEDLRDDYSSTMFATMAGLSTARMHLEANEGDEAGQWLDWVRRNAPETPLQALATIRLARVYLEYNKAEEGLALLEDWSEEGWEGLRLELIGDLHHRAGRPDDARKAYEAARQIDGGHDALRFKLDNLGVVHAQP